MPAPKPPSPSIPDAIAAMNPQIPGHAPDLVMNAIANSAAEGVAQAMQQAQAPLAAAHLSQAAAAAARHNHSLDATDPQDPASILRNSFKP